MFKSLEDVNGKKVLIIDEEVDLCMLMRAFLIRKNCTVKVTHTLKDAFKSIQNDPPGVILLDRFFTNRNTIMQQIKELDPGVEIYP